MLIMALAITFFSPVAVASEESSDYQIYGWSFWAAMGVAATLVIWLGVSAAQVAHRRSRTAEEWHSLHQDWSKETCKLIAEGTIQQGMTKEQVRAARGEPNDINRTVTEYGTREQWVYGSSPSGRKYLYFKDGKLTGWQT